MRTLLTVVLLGVAGAALLVGTFSVTTSGPVHISPFFLMTVLAPIVMRRVIGETSRRATFVNCTAVGTVMSVVFLVWFAVVMNPAGAPWYAYARALAFLLGCVAAVSAIVAIVSTTPDAADKRNVRGALLRVIASAGTFGVCYSLIGLLRRPPPSGSAVLTTLSWSVFLAFFFVLVSVVIYLPILASVRRLLHQHSRVPLAILGAFLFPIPMLAFPFLQGRLDDMIRLLLSEPATSAFMALPYVLGGAALGWLMAMPRDDVRHGRLA